MTENSVSTNVASNKAVIKENLVFLEKGTIKINKMTFSEIENLTKQGYLPSFPVIISHIINSKDKRYETLKKSNYDFEKYGFKMIDATSLRVRENSNTKSKVIDNVQKKEIVYILETTDKVETIENKTAPWVKVITPNAKTGYVFAGFLKR